MAGPFLFDYVAQNATAAGGTGTISMGTVIDGRVDWVSAGAGGKLVYYYATDDVNAEWGEGTITDGTPDTLSRDTVIGNTLGTTNAVDFGAATIKVYCALPASRTVYLGSGVAGPAIVTAIGKSVLTAADAAAIRTLLELGSAATKDAGGWAGLDADSVDGYEPDTTASGDSIVARTPSGHAHAVLFNTSQAATERSADSVFYSGSGDGFIRPNTDVGMRSSLGLGSAATADTGDFMAAPYTGSSSSATVLPVGHPVLAVMANNGSGAPNRNGSTAVYLDADARQYTIVTAGTLLSGTWRSRGGLVGVQGDDPIMMQRVA